ncbi:MAG: hypothetical protein ACETWD_01105 [Desulfatiglandales bacterium]
MPRAIHDPHVFLYNGKPIRDLRTALRKACSGAGPAGVTESVIMAITGHSTREMFNRYNTVDAEDIRLAVDQLETYLANVDYSVDQVGKNDKKKD